MRVWLACLAAAGDTAFGFDVQAFRPAPESWKRTQCGGPSGSAEIPTKWGLEVGPSAQPLTAYPRPQMVRRAGNAPGSGPLSALRDAGDPDTWANLNGLWEWEKAESDVPPVGRVLAGSILVPFPVESCLSGVAPQRSADIVERMWYRLTFDSSNVVKDGFRTLLHFGAVDWQASIYFNGVLLGNHTGAYDGFSFDITDSANKHGNELIVYVFDPSDRGAQPNGKQKISAIDKPGGDQYTPSSGIWQTVWLESVPMHYIMDLKINQASLHSVSIEAAVNGIGYGAGEIDVDVLEEGSVIASGRGTVGKAIIVEVPSPALWSPERPKLYDLKVRSAVQAPQIAVDTVISYFGLRTITIGPQPGAIHTSLRPLLNNKFTFFAGFLDQSWWPDGQYTAPTDEALAYDLEATKMFGMNMIRLHQKVNPERWYYHADRLGLAIFQDMPQKYGGAVNETIPLFVEDMKSMISGRGNHPCIIQWTTFNEGDCVGVFKTPPNDVKSITQLAKRLDSTRLVDTNSGGPANNLHIADVNDIHSYPFPGDPMPSASQYAMVGEFGGIGAFIQGKEWVPGLCHTYLKAANSSDEATKYIQMASSLQSRADHISASVYTQTTDVELECDGFLNYDRSNKFSVAETKAIHDANQALVGASGGQVYDKQLRLQQAAPGGMVFV